MSFITLLALIYFIPLMSFVTILFIYRLFLKFHKKSTEHLVDYAIMSMAWPIVVPGLLLLYSLYSLKDLFFWLIGVYFNLESKFISFLQRIFE